ncbi:MAG: Abi family protein [Eggerthellaceae bacterium]
MSSIIAANIKPWLCPYEQVEHLKSKGVRFELMSESEACEYLTENNNYFRLCSYRAGFAKVEEGFRKGQYANLDFKMLVDLSIVDTLLRNEILPMTLDIEHFEKVHLINRIGQTGEDGYGIVADFLARYDQMNSRGELCNSVRNEITRGASSPYAAGIIAKYSSSSLPVWAFLELITFGSFLLFYKFCAKRFDSKEMIDRFYLLQNVKSLRNACAHNNCILNNMTSGKPMFSARNEICRAISRIESIGKSQRKSKLRNDSLQQIATSLYVHSLVASEDVHWGRAKQLQLFVERMNRYADYYRGNYQISSGFDFIASLINAWFSCAVDVR